MNKLRFINHIKSSGAMQMAIDEAIMIARSKDLVPNTLRFYTWNPAAITIGFFQEIEHEVNLKKTKELGIDVIRRYTGGGAVLHDTELTYSIVISEKDVPSDILESYKKICGGVINSLKLLGICAEFKPVNDILVGGKKISGNAQTRKHGVVLQHGTILLDVNLEKMFSVLKVSNEKLKDKIIKTAEDRVTCIKKELDRKITIKEIENSLKKGFEQEFNTTCIEEKLTSNELKTAKELYTKKYSAKDWTYCNSAN